MDTKKCCGCKKNLPRSCFKSRKRASDGLQSQCIDCQRAYRRQHYLANKKKYIGKAAVWRKSFRGWWKDYKVRFKCAECGENHPACIQFHHNEDDKEETVSRLVMSGCKQRVLKEIEKCTPLCANCHAKKHWRV